MYDKIIRRPATFLIPRLCSGWRVKDGSGAYEEHQPPFIPDSDDVAGIELRMLPPFIRNNRMLKIWPFPGKAKLYCLTMVVSDVANQLSGFIDLNAFPRVSSGTLLPVNKTLFYWEQGGVAQRAPNQVHVLCTVIKSKEALRETATILSTVREDDRYRELVDRMGSIVSDTASSATVMNIALEIAGIVGGYLGRVEDRPLGTMVQSFTRLHGDWDQVGIRELAVAAGDVDFALELVVRDAGRQSVAQSGVTVVPASYALGSVCALKPL